MGDQSPYLNQNESESDMEESDDEPITSGLDDEKFLETVEGFVRQIMEKKYTIEATMINLLQIKHGYSKTNIDC